MATRKSINQSNYDRKHCRTYGLKLNLATDADIIEKLSTVDSMQGYIKQLIRQDIARTCPGSAPEYVSEPFKDPFTDIITKAIGTWNDKASSILSDERPYAIKDSAPDL